jgi:hypothetical protein
MSCGNERWERAICEPCVDKALAAKEAERADSQRRFESACRGISRNGDKAMEFYKRADAAEERLREAVGLIEGLVYASDRCMGHRGCGHSMEPWGKARAFLATPSPQPPSGEPQHPFIGFDVGGTDHRYLCGFALEKGYCGRPLSDPIHDHDALSCPPHCTREGHDMNRTRRTEHWDERYIEGPDTPPECDGWCGRNDSHEMHMGDCGWCGGNRMHRTDCTRPAPSASEKPTCAICGKPATCFGRYEHPDNPEQFACDDCCGHGNEDGHCEPIAPPSGTPEPVSRCERCGRPWSVKTCPECIKGGPPDPPAAPAVGWMREAAIDIQCAYNLPPEKIEDLAGIIRGAAPTSEPPTAPTCPTCGEPLQCEDHGTPEDHAQPPAPQPERPGCPHGRPYPAECPDCKAAFKRGVDIAVAEPFVGMDWQIKPAEQEGRKPCHTPEQHERMMQGEMAGACATVPGPEPHRFFGWISDETCTDCGKPASDPVHEVTR